MTISNTARTAGPYAGTGANTSFPFTFKVFARSDLLVVRTVASTSVDSVLVLDVDYTITLNTSQNSTPGGTITLAVPLAVGSSLVATSALPVQQSLELTNQGGFYPTVINDAFDRIVILIQQMTGTLARTLRFPLSDGLTIRELPSAGARANKILSFDSTGNPVATAPVSGSATALQILLATFLGSSLLGFLQKGIGMAVRTVEDKFKDILSVMDVGSIGVGGDDTVGIMKVITELAARGSGNITNRGGMTFRISAQIDFSILGGEHRQYEIDFAGAFFIWIGDPNYTGPMFKGYNTKSVKIKNFTLLGSTTTTRSKVMGLWLNSLQPNGSDLLSFQNFRIAYCDYGFVLGSTGAGQNRVSDSQISHGVIENCRIGLSARSTDVDSLVIGPCLIISSCDIDIELTRAGFVKIYDVTGYNSAMFIAKKGPTEAILVENCQSERGDLTSSIFYYQSNYTISRTAPLTFLNCVADDKIWLDYDPLVGSDPQTVNIIGGKFTDLSIDAPDATVNLIGTTQVDGGVMAISGANSKVYNMGSRLFGNTVDYANARRFAIYGDAGDNYAIGIQPGLFAATGRTVLMNNGPTSSLYGLAVNGNPSGYLAATGTVVELAATGANRLDLTAGAGPVASATQNGAFNLTPLSAPPASPNPGAIYYNGPNKKFYGYDGTTWTVFN